MALCVYAAPAYIGEECEVSVCTNLVCTRDKGVASFPLNHPSAFAATQLVEIQQTASRSVSRKGQRQKCNALFISVMARNKTIGRPQR